MSLRLRQTGLGLLLLCVAGLAGAAPVTTPKKASEVLDTFHAALRKNQPDAVLAVLAKDAVLYEQGFAETTRDEWARKQLGNAIAFARDTDRRVVRRQSGQSGDAAWVISTTQTVLDVSGRQVVLEGAETAILRRQNAQDNWQIVHLHWSAHEADEAAAAPAPDSKPKR